MLRASSDATQSSYQVDAIAQGPSAGDGNIPHGALLVEFCDAAQNRDEEAMAPLRKSLVERLGNEALVDTCGVIANFQRMVRIADGTGIPLDDFMLSVSGDLRADLKVTEFRGAQSSRLSLGRRLMHRLVRSRRRRGLVANAALKR